MLLALGLTPEEILSTFYKSITYSKNKDGWSKPYLPEQWRGEKPNADLIDAATGKVIAKAGAKISARAANKLAEDGVNALLVADEDLIGRYAAFDHVNPETGEIFIEAGDEITHVALVDMKNAGIEEIDVLAICLLYTSRCV